MTAVRNNMTLQRLERLANLVDFINEHGDKLGPLTTLGANSSYCSAQIYSYSGGTRPEDIAASVITWIYLLDNASLEVTRTSEGEPGVHIEVDGQFRGHHLKAYCGIGSSAAAEYLLSLPEITIHSLRRIQIGDVPEVDGELVPA